MIDGVPVFANQAPWNELVLRGKRQVKTISFPWRHRGLILLYTSHTRVDSWGAELYGITQRELSFLPRGVIVGYATVKDVVPVWRLPNEFYERDTKLAVSDGHSYIVILEDPKRFKRSIRFTPPRGTVRISSAPALYLKRQIQETV